MLLHVLKAFTLLTIIGAALALAFYGEGERAMKALGVLWMVALAAR